MLIWSILVEFGGEEMRKSNDRKTVFSGSCYKFLFLLKYLLLNENLQLFQSILESSFAFPFGRDLTSLL